MKSTRRNFLKGVSAGFLCLTLGQLGFDLGEAQAYAVKLKIEGAKEVTSVCPFCSVCCQVIAHVRDGKLVSTEGDPDFPVNEGALCAKGAALFTMYTSHHRLEKPLYRAPHSDHWVEKDWEWTLNEIARRVKDARDEDMILKNAKGQTVNRLESISPWAPRTPPTRNAPLSIKPCAAWVLSIWTTRRGSDTAPLLRLWQSRSDAAQ